MPSSSPVVVRFAPSPTGFLHIGGARTALFNWAYAQKMGGKLCLRIEDTDRARSTQAATEAILEGLTWLGLGWDGEAISQFSRAQRHRDVALELLALGKAYRCYATPQELDEMRALAEHDGRSPRYDGRWRDRDPAEAPEGAPFAVRLKAPREGETVVVDHVQGRVVFPNADLDDLVLLRSDGTPTYTLSVVVDDHDMGVTHIIRGVDHLTNAARQTLIYQALGWDVPQMAHIPLIHGSDGAKLSKRHGALGVEAYRAMGYLPEALCTYLARLGWAHGDEEIFSRDEFVAWFSLEGIGKSPARFDFAKLDFINAHYLKSLEPEVLFERFFDFLPFFAGEGHWILERSIDEEACVRLKQGLLLVRDRVKTLAELALGSRYFLELSDLDDEARACLEVSGGELGPLAGLLKEQPWEKSALEGAVKGYAKEKGLGFGRVAPAIRAALTGTMTSPGIFDVLLALGRGESLLRMERGAALGRAL